MPDPLDDSSLLPERCASPDPTQLQGLAQRASSLLADLYRAQRLRGSTSSEDSSAELDESVLSIKSGEEYQDDWFNDSPGAESDNKSIQANGSVEENIAWFSDDESSDEKEIIWIARAPSPEHHASAPERKSKSTSSLFSAPITHTNFWRKNPSPPPRNFTLESVWPDPTRKVFEAEPLQPCTVFYTRPTPVRVQEKKAQILFSGTAASFASTESGRPCGYSPPIIRAS